MSDLEEVWAACSAILRKQVPEPTWNACFAPLAAVEVSGDKFVLAAPNSMVRKLVATRFRRLIEEVLARVIGSDRAEVELVVQEPADFDISLLPSYPANGNDDELS